MGEVLKIFISATSADLRAVREAARDFFNRHDNYKAREQEHRDLVPATLLANDQHHLEDCDAVLHIVGECYGEEPPADGGARRSYTQREYDYARQLGKPLYLFVCEEHFPYAEHQPEPEEKHALQRAHRIAILRGDIRYERIADFPGLEKQLGRIKLDAQRLAEKLRETEDRFDAVGEDVRRLEKGITAIDPLQQYYQNLREQFANYDNVGLPVAAREGKEEKEEPIKIRDLFVSPHCSAQHIRPAELDAAVREGKTLGQPLLPLLGKPGARLVLLADPGMGKSTVIQYLIATLADGKAPAGAPGLRGAVPFPFILRELARLLPEDVKQWNWDALLDAFCRWDPRSDGEGPLAAPIADRATFRTFTGSEDAFFLIDGLDEIGDLLKRVAIRDAIWEGVSRNLKARWVITSRLIGYEPAEVHAVSVERAGLDAMIVGGMFLKGSLLARLGFSSALDTAQKAFSHRAIGADFQVAGLLYLAPFNDAQQRAFAEHWYVPRMGDAQGKARAAKFIEAVHQHPHTQVIGRIPNLLYLMALLYRHQAQLPHGRALVYEAISEAYLESIPLQRLLLGEAAAYSQSFPVKEQLLAVVGMKMQQMRASRKEGEDGDILVSREQLGEWLGARFDSPAALEEFLDHVARDSGLLLPRGEEVYGFAHLSFQEYYAACHLRSDFERIVTAKARPASGFLRRATPAADEHEERLFAEYAARPVWHEPLLFLVEKFRGNQDFTAQLLDWMFPQLAGDPAKGKDWMPLPAAQLLATLSIDPEVALELAQRDAIWQALWKAESTEWDYMWRLAPSLVVAGSVFQAGVLQAAAAPGPQRLNLSECPALNDVKPLAGLTGLQILNLSDCPALSDLTPLAGLTGLQELNLSYCRALSDLRPLAGLTGLQELFLRRCPALDDLTPLARLTRLQDLALSGCPALGDLRPLAGLTDLNTLDLGGCTGLDDLAPLAGLKYLPTLYLSECPALSDLRPLAGLTAMQRLYLSDCPALSDLTPLAGLPGLRTLDLRGCTGLGDPSPLAGLTGLRTLDLRGCTGLGDPSPLAGLTGLRTLDLRGCTGLGEAEAAKLRQALPRCHIRWQQQ